MEARSEPKPKLRLNPNPNPNPQPPTHRSCSAASASAIFPAVSAADEITYRCPGESYPISRSVHLGRLASFYEKCRECPHRADAHPLAPRVVSQLQETHARRPAPLFLDEGVAGVLGNQVDPGVARGVAAALGMLLRATGPADETPSAVLGSDGRAEAAEIVAAASAGLQFAGCQVVDVGAVTAGAISAALPELAAAGGMLVGNALGKPGHVSLKCWGLGGRPLSAGGELDMVRRAWQSGIDRPSRTFGGWRSADAGTDYLANLAPCFHALRPLRVVIDTACRPFERYLKSLAGAVQCEFFWLGDDEAPRTSREPTPALRRGERLARTMRQTNAHFGFWTDGDAETCRVFDDAGRPVPCPALLRALAGATLRDRPGSWIVLEEDAPAWLAEDVKSLGGSVAFSRALRAAMDQALRDTGAWLGGGLSGRFWFRRRVPAADALETLTRLLMLLSRGDRPLSSLVATKPAS